MRKSKIRRLAYKYLVKEEHTHQETFDELKKNVGIDLDLLAEEVAKIPSVYKHEKMKSYRLFFILCLSLVGIFRLLGLYSLIAIGGFNLLVLLMALLLSLLVPVIGIIGAVKRKSELYLTVSVLMALGIFRSLSKGELNFDVSSLIVLLPTVGGIVLAFVLMEKLKTNFTKTLKEKEVNGEIKKYWDYKFDEESYTNKDLLDTDF